MINKRFFVLLFVFASYTLYAQNTHFQANSVLEKTAKKYNELSTFSLDFKINIEEAEKNINSFTGVLFVKKDKYYLTFEEQVLANDGNLFWNYQSNSNEATLFDADEDELILFHPLTILNNWSNDYTASVRREENLQKKMTVLVDLIPKQKTSFIKLRLFIDKETSYIRQIIIYENERMTITYTITKFTPNTPISDAKFTFNKNDFPNVQVIDMR
jgi:outer membrane lipoprotein-sorting protein